MVFDGWLDIMISWLIFVWNGYVFLFISLKSFNRILANAMRIYGVILVVLETMIIIDLDSKEFDLWFTTLFYHWHGNIYL